MFQKIKSFLFENKTARQTVVKNTFWLVITNFGGRALKAIVIIYAARVLGTEGYGVFSYVVALAGFFTIFVDPGITSIIMREVSKANDVGKREFLSATLVIKFVLVFAGILIVLFVAPFFSTLPGTKALLPLVALILTFDTFREFLSSFIRARERMEWESGIFLLTNLSIVVAGFVLLSKSPTPPALVWGYVLGTAVGALAAVWVLRDYLKNIFSYFSTRLIFPIFRSAWPFAIVGALGVLLTNADILIISWMRSASEVGIYSAAIRIVQMLYLVPSIFQYSTLPVIARLANDDRARFRSAFERTMGMVFLASVPLVLGGIILGTPIMRLVFGAAYVAGGPAFKLLMLTMLFDFPLTILSAGIFAYDHQRSLIVSSAIAGIVNVVLDLLLIPPFGITGSAVATLIAQAITSWYLWHTMKKLNHFEVIPKLKRIATAGITMALATALLLALHLNVIINIALSAAVYFGALAVLREPLLMEIRSVLRPGTENAPETTNQ